MWYRAALARIQRRSAVSVDELWKELDKTAVPGKFGIGDKASFRDFVGEPPPDDAPELKPAPIAPPEEKRTKADDAYYEGKRRRKKKENLGLEDVVDIEPGNIPIQRPIVDPTDDSIPEEAAVERVEAEEFPEEMAVKMQQAGFEQSGLGKLPQVHEGCRCTVRDLGGAYKWLLADSGACPDCQQNSAKFNSLSNKGL